MRKIILATFLLALASDCFGQWYRNSATTNALPVAAYVSGILTNNTTGSSGSVSGVTSNGTVQIPDNAGVIFLAASNGVTTIGGTTYITNLFSMGSIGGTNYTHTGPDGFWNTNTAGGFVHIQNGTITATNPVNGGNFVTPTNASTAAYVLTASDANGSTKWAAAGSSSLPTAGDAGATLTKHLDGNAVWARWLFDDDFAGTTRTILAGGQLGHTGTAGSGDSLGQLADPTIAPRYGTIRVVIAATNAGDYYVEYPIDAGGLFPLTTPCTFAAGFYSSSSAALTTNHSVVCGIATSYTTNTPLNAIRWVFDPLRSTNLIAEIINNGSSVTWTSSWTVAANSWYDVAFDAATNNSVIFYTNASPASGSAWQPVYTNSTASQIPWMTNSFQPLLGCYAACTNQALYSYTYFDYLKFYLHR